MGLLRLFSLAKEGWINRPRAELFSIRAQALRTMALGVTCAPPAEGAPSWPDQDTYVRLTQIAQTSPRDAVLEGWSEVSRLLRLVADQRAIERAGGTIGMLNVLEGQKAMDFHAYALLRDMHAFHADAAKTASAAELTPTVAQDFAIAVRGALRLLHGLAALK